jgi:hypothetical protein
VKTVGVLVDDEEDVDPVTFLEVFLAGTTLTGVVFNEPVQVMHTGLTCVDAAVRGIKMAEESGHPVEIVHNGVWVQVDQYSVVDNVVKYMPTPGNNWELLEIEDTNAANAEWANADKAREAAMRNGEPVILSFRGRKIVVHSTDALGEIQDRIVRH